eukprot:XP_001705455.1 High cysteine protein [Giardia lamblia ATCC 50803]
MKSVIAWCYPEFIVLCFAGVGGSLSNQCRIFLTSLCRCKY